MPPPKEKPVTSKVSVAVEAAGDARGARGERRRRPCRGDRAERDGDVGAVTVMSPLACGAKSKSPLIDWPSTASVPVLTEKDLTIVASANVTWTPGLVEPGMSISWSIAWPVSL